MNSDPERSMLKMTPSWIKVEIPDILMTIGSVELLEIIAQTNWIARNVDVVINVTDSPYFTFTPMAPATRTLWFPIDEYTKWPIASLFGAIRALNDAVSKEERIFLHCSGGINRSRHVAAIWHYCRGMSEADAGKRCGLRPDFLSRLVDGGSVMRRDIKLLQEAMRSTFSLGSIRSYIDGNGPAESEDPN